MYDDVYDDLYADVYVDLYAKSSTIFGAYHTV